ncbi:MAG: 50S ribosomal protein L7/L12 [Endomicrobium sp.]|jgi:large subunit ribosomal protein L7/L12|nr:50S ribosomal protein L7/L12 [Endomicrobium sp.]
MAELSKDQLVDAISSLSVIELSELVKTLENKFGVSSAAPVAVAAAPVVGDSSASVTSEEKSEFSVVLTSAGTSKISVIKIVREITGLGLKESKDLVDSVPKIVKENVIKVEAEEIKKKLTEVGASVELK